MSEREERLKRLNAGRGPKLFSTEIPHWLDLQKAQDDGYKKAKEDVMKELHEVLLIMVIQGIQAKNAEVQRTAHVMLEILTNKECFPWSPLAKEDK